MKPSLLEAVVLHPGSWYPQLAAAEHLSLFTLCLLAGQVGASWQN